MALSDSFLQELKMKTDIEDVISTYVTLKRRGATLVGLCPFHNEKTPSFTVYPATQSFYCFGCGAGGDAITFVKKIENLDYLDAVKTLALRAGLQMPQEGFDDSLSKRRRRILEMNREAARFYHSVLLSPEGKVGYDYYIGRALSAATINHFGLGFAPNQWDALLKHMRAKGYQPAELVDAGLARKGQKGYYDNFRNRVMTPIIDVRGNVIAFGGRVLDDSKPKYINTGDTLVYKKTNELFALNFAKDSKEDALILCEGYMDVISMHQAGFTNAVASLGTALTSGHASLVKRYTKEVLLLYDSDGAGIRAALRAIPILREAGVTSRVVSLKPWKDPDEFIKNEGAEAFEERLNQAMDSFMFRVHIAEQEFAMDAPQGQNQFFERCAEMLLELSDELERNLYIEAIVKEYGRYGVGTEDIRKRVNTLALKGTPAEKRIQPKSGTPETKKKESAADKAQKLMLTWLVNYPGIFEQVEKYISPSDFVVPLYKEVAQMLFDQHKEGETNPGKLLNAFTDSEEQREVASLFNATIHLENEGEQQRAFSDTLLRIKEESLKEKNRTWDPSDMAGLQELIKAKKELEDLGRKRQQLHISFN